MGGKKNLILTGIIYAIFFILYNLLVFLIFETRTSVFWVSYGFMTIAFIGQIASMFLSFTNMDVETFFYGIPLVSISIYYLLAELFCSLVFMIFQGAGIKAAIIIQSLLLGGFVSVSIIALMARDAVQGINAHIKENVNFIKSIHVDIEMLLQKANDAELKISLKKLSETVKYADPMTWPEVADVDQRIMQKLSETRAYCTSEKIDQAKKACMELELLFIERNKKLFISK